MRIGDNMKVYEIFSDVESSDIQIPDKWTESYGKLNRKITVELSDADKIKIEFEDGAYGTPLEGKLAVISFFRGGYTLNDRGDALKVFNVVLAVCKKYLAETRPTFLLFSSKNSEESRTKLYRTMIRRLAPSFGYKLIEFKDLPRELRNEVWTSEDAHDFVLMNTSAR